MQYIPIEWQLMTIASDTFRSAENHTKQKVRESQANEWERSDRTNWSSRTTRPSSRQRTRSRSSRTPVSAASQYTKQVDVT